MTTGRSEKLEPFTFVDTGRTVKIRKVSTLLRAEVRTQVLGDPDYAEPQPPMSSVDYGDGMIHVPNRAHPIYQQLLGEWRQRVQDEVARRLKRVALARGVVVDAIDMDAVAAVREELDASGVDLSAFDDRHVYLAFVCIGSESDWAELLRAIFERSAPQEAAIQAHIATFQPDLPGAPAVP